MQKQHNEQDGVNTAILSSLSSTDAGNYRVGDMLAPEFGEKKVRYSATGGGGWKGNVHSWGFEQLQ